MIKKTLIGLGSLLGLLVFAVVILSFLVDEAEIFTVLSDSVEKETESKLIIGEDSAVTFFPTLGLNLVEVQVIPNNPANSSVEADQVEVGVTLPSLLAGTIEIKTIKAVGLKTTIIQTNDTPSETPKTRTDEELEVYYAERRTKLEAGVTGEGLPPIPLDLEIGILEISDAVIAIHDPKSNSSKTVKIVEMNMQDFNTRGEPSSVSGSISISGESDIELKVQTGLAVDLTEGMIQLSYVNLELAGVTPEILLVEASGELDLTKETAQLDIEVKTDQITAIGVIRRAAYQSPEIDMELAINLIDLAMLVPTSNESDNSNQVTKNSSSKESSANSNNIQDVPLPLDALRNLDLKAQLEIDQVSIGPNILKEVGASMRILEGVLTLSEVSGQFNGGFLSLESQLDARYNRANFSAEGGLEGIDFNQVATSYGAPGVISGNGGISLKLSSQGSTQKEMIRNLSGPENIKTSGDTLQKISLEKTMCQGIALVNKKILSRSFPNNTEFASLDANLQFTDGRGKIGPFSADLASLKLEGGGEFDLVSNDFSLVLEGTIFESIGELDPACVLDSKYTNLIWPVNCKGNLSEDPSEWCKVDTANVLAQFAKETVKDEAKKKAKTYIKKLFGG